jgi:hypothetical protein
MAQIHSVNGVGGIQSLVFQEQLAFTYIMMPSYASQFSNNLYFNNAFNSPQ